MGCPCWPPPFPSSTIHRMKKDDPEARGVPKKYTVHVGSCSGRGGGAAFSRPWGPPNVAGGRQRSRGPRGARVTTLPSRRWRARCGARRWAQVGGGSRPPAGLAVGWGGGGLWWRRTDQRCGLGGRGSPPPPLYSALRGRPPPARRVARPLVRASAAAVVCPPPRRPPRHTSYVTCGCGCRVRNAPAVCRCRAPTDAPSRCRRRAAPLPPPRHPLPPPPYRLFGGPAAALPRLVLPRFASSHLCPCAGPSSPPPRPPPPRVRWPLFRPLTHHHRHPLASPPRVKASLW